MIIYFLIIFLNFSNFLLSFIYFFFFIIKKNCFVNFVIIFKIISFKTALEISTL